MDLQACPRILLIALASRPLNTSLLSVSAAAHGVPLISPSMPHKILGARRRIFATQLEALANRSCGSTVAVILDAYDTFLRCDASELEGRVLSSGANVLLSAELLFSKQIKATKGFYDELAANASNPTPPYRYLNVGGIAGRVDALYPFMRAASREPVRKGAAFNSADADQAPVSSLFVRDHLLYGASLDYSTRVFYVASGPDWKFAKAHARMSTAEPCIVHVPATFTNRNARETLHSLFRVSTTVTPGRPRNADVRPLTSDHY